MSGSSDSTAKDTGGRKSLSRVLAFPLSVASAYTVLYTIMPRRTIAALEASGQILIQVALPLCIAFIIMFVLHLLVKPVYISRFLGKGAGAKGVIISTLAGIISTGPIYAWYPLLKDLLEKGASEFHISNFLCNRAVKPFLLPVMLFYFGWVFVLILNVLIVVGAVLTGLLVSALTTGSQVWKERT